MIHPADPGGRSLGNGKEIKNANTPMAAVARKRAAKLLLETMSPPMTGLTTPQTSAVFAPPLVALAYAAGS
jgi:hypothetical protein